ncbi:histidinol-phosphate transaminase [Verruconis gallopava]|uniref:histidinol-phosphate transaminase n=1 Tax=Verruconis gallopava TaxID=253628 RepID=A0A0D2B9T3_9PEZI|nr:histidinol-phosphate transaminase [Verruconis gallopava]KIW07979.1 histidinol-phosphate transaminase [Verruconis gallopava]
MVQKKSPFDLQKCARPNILALQPYRCARDDYKDDGTNILLDANENAYGPGLSIDPNGTIDEHKSSVDLDLLGLHRYPDPHQPDLKRLLCSLRNTHTHTSKDLTPDNLFVGVGSDEAIDNLLRCFCTPGKDKILTCPPTYGMYKVSACVNDVAVVAVPLRVEDNFRMDVPAVLEALSSNADIKLVYLCSPGNPTGTLIPKEDIRPILEHPTWNGIVVLDEAYIDFAPDGASLAEWVLEWPNLVVMQTLSKAFGLAGIRLGAAFADPAVAQLLNNLKAPYNISNPTSQIAQAALKPDNLSVMRENRKKILAQRDRMIEELPKIPGIGNFKGGYTSNFLLVEMLDAPKEEGGKPSNDVALKVYETLAESKGVVVRFRGNEIGCLGCLRITVGTKEEVDRFLKEIEAVLSDIYTGRTSTKATTKGAQRKDLAANGTVA